MRMLALRLQFHQVDDVDNADLQRRKVLAEEIYGSQRFQRWYVSATRHYDVWFRSFVIARPFPDPNARRTMFDHLVHREQLRNRLFTCSHEVDIISAAQTRFSHR